MNILYCHAGTASATKVGTAHTVSILVQAASDFEHESTMVIGMKSNMVNIHYDTDDKYCKMIHPRRWRAIGARRNRKLYSNQYVSNVW